MKFLRTLLILGRISNLPTVWTNVVVGWLIGGGLFSFGSLIWLITGVSLLYWAGMTLNDAFDADWDRENAPERPIPSGAISPGSTWIVGTAQMIAGIAILLFKTDVDWMWLAALVGAILAYDWIHKKWKGSVLIMGLCRSLVYLMVWDAARADRFLPPTSPLIYVIAVGVLIYIAALTLVARGERKEEKGANLSFIPRFLLLAPMAFPILTLNYEPTLRVSDFLLFGGALLSATWIVYIRTLLSASLIPRAIGNAIAGIALYDATVAGLIDWSAGLFCISCFILTLILQRFVPAT